jgi:cytochrome c oxidase subunit 3
MMFIGFTSAYMVRRVSADWRPLPAIPLLWVNTAALLASSVALEAARRRLRGFDLRGAEAWLLSTGVLGVAFFAGQVFAWRTLVARGFLLASSPHHSFFYLLTGVHLAHLLGALVWYGVAQVRLRRMAYPPGEDGLGLFATFWHFLGGLWLYLLLLLFVL